MGLMEIVVIFLRNSGDYHSSGEIRSEQNAHRRQEYRKRILAAGGQVFSESNSVKDFLARSILRNGIAPLRDLTHRISLKLVTEIGFVHVVFLPKI
jgi:hypothetical protein